ncbi:MAG: hypothetical protein ACJ76B_00345 [Solirubrobacterales bacterium]
MADDYLGYYSSGFKLEGTNGYEILIGGFSERLDGRGKVYVGVRRADGKGGIASYATSGIVSEGFLKADLGELGRLDMALRKSGHEKTVHIKCSRDSYPFEPGVYEGVVEFEGEGGYTSARATSVAELPPTTSYCGSGSGYGESRGPGEPGARLRGVSFAHGRTLSFQINKNHQSARTFFKAELGERRDGIVIHRAVEGVAPAGAFRYDPRLETAQLAPPQPFSGSAVLVRDPDSFPPRWSGDLTLDFLGHPDVPLAGPQIGVALAHAHFTRSNSAEVSIGAR